MRRIIEGSAVPTGKSILLDQMLDLAEELLGIRVFICEISMDLMGFKREEIIDYKNLTFCGVAKFLEEAQDSKIQLFI